MDKILAFKVFCLENYKSTHNLDGKTALDIFRQYQVFEYIADYYDVLHGYGRLYLINDIDEFIANRK